MNAAVESNDLVSKSCVNPQRQTIDAIVDAGKRRSNPLAIK